MLASAGAGALAGGLLFGAGMTLAGGCGAGSIWRAGEGQVKLWAAVVCFALGASLTRLALAQAGLLGKLGIAVFLPAAVGWGAAIVLIVVVMAAWWAFATWNEAARRFSAL
ncbi:MAG: YeeE/YedE family protein [Candidatus Rokubacteria bacterium]|nr:YeeE/YedE family protein [Candidatus Rokubacteria bacterium]